MTAPPPPPPRRVTDIQAGHPWLYTGAGNRNSSLRGRAARIVPLSHYPSPATGISNSGETKTKQTANNNEKLPRLYFYKENQVKQKLKDGFILVFFCLEKHMCNV